MEGNFLSRYNNKIQNWKELIEKEPSNKSLYENEMSQYTVFVGASLTATKSSPDLPITKAPPGIRVIP